MAIAKRVKVIFWKSIFCFYYFRKINILKCKWISKREIQYPGNKRSRKYAIWFLRNC